MSATLNMNNLSRNDYFFDNPKHQPVITPAQHLSPLNDRVCHLFDNTQRSIYRVDNVLTVNVPSDQFREAMRTYWEAQRVSSKKHTWCARIAAALCGIGGGVAANMNINPLVIVALAIGAIVSLIFSSCNAYWTSQASYQKAGWEISPVQVIAEERETAFKEGFKYVYARDLRLGGLSWRYAALLPAEIEYLFNNYFDQFYDHLLRLPMTTDQEKKEWIEAFSNDNSLSKKLLEYVYPNPNTTPFYYAEASIHFENIEIFLKDLQNKFDQLRNDMCSENGEIIENINNKRAVALYLFNIILNDWELLAKKNRDEKLAQLGTNGKQEVEDEYLHAVDNYKHCYDEAVAPVHAYFDGKVKEVRDNLSQILEKIEQNKTSAIVCHFNYACALLNYVKQAKDNYKLGYQYLFFMPIQALHMDAPSPPLIDQINFIDQARTRCPAFFLLATR